MFSYIVRRILYLLPVCVGILLVTFLIKAAIPTDVVSMLYSGQLTEADSAEAEAIIRAEFHLDQPPLVQFYYYVSDVLHGNLGISVRTREPVADEIGYRYLNTMELALASLIIGVFIGVSTGIISAYYKDTIFDVVAMTVSLVWPVHAVVFLWDFVDPAVLRFPALAAGDRRWQLEGIAFTGF